MSYMFIDTGCNNKMIYKLQYKIKNNIIIQLKHSEPQAFRSIHKQSINLETILYQTH